MSKSIKQHQNIFVIASDAQAAKQKAVQQIKQWESPHRDYLHEIDTVLDLGAMLTKQNHYLHLVETQDDMPFEFTCRYTPIGK